LFLFLYLFILIRPFKLFEILPKATTHPMVRERLLTFIQDCAKDFSPDPSLSLLNSEYNNLLRQGVTFPSKQPPPRSASEKEKEEEEMQLALALSLSENEAKSVSLPYLTSPKTFSSFPNLSHFSALFSIIPVSHQSFRG